MFFALVLAYCLLDSSCCFKDACDKKVDIFTQLLKKPGLVENAGPAEVRKNLGMLACGCIFCPLFEIGLTDLPKFGGGGRNPLPPVSPGSAFPGMACIAYHKKR
jgi:hypothetical protein